MGHISIKFPLKEEKLKKRNKRFQAHAVEDDDQEDEKKNKEDEYSKEEYVLISLVTKGLLSQSIAW